MLFSIQTITALTIFNSKDKLVLIWRYTPIFQDQIFKEEILGVINNLWGQNKSEFVVNVPMFMHFNFDADINL